MAEIIQDSHQFLVNTTLIAQWEDTLPYPTTRKIYRHESNEGSVIEFDMFGKKVKLFVADAKYRGLNLTYDTSHRSHGNPQLPVTTASFNGSVDNKTQALTYNKNDAWIQSTYPQLRNDGTAKSNTDFLMSFNTTDAAHHCRNQNISGIGQLDLPNLYELIILYLESDNIDALDPTASSNRDKALGKMNTYGRFDFNNQRRVWSSTEDSSVHAWYVHDGGSVGTTSQNYYGGAAPVQELS